jgi:hypothetical protein
MKITVFNDFLNQQSWGRVCSCVALLVAVYKEIFSTIDTTHLAIWLSVAVGTYTASKITQMITNKTVIEDSTNQDK